MNTKPKPPCKCGKPYHTTVPSYAKNGDIAFPPLCKDCYLAARKLVAQIIDLGISEYSLPARLCPRSLEKE